MLYNFLLVFLGGGAGSAARFGISLLLINYSKSFPVATLVSNVLSCLVLGLAVFFMGEKFNADVSTRLLLITGFCGGFSTFSAFSFETVEMLRSGNILYALLNVAVSVLVCFGVTWILVKSN